MTHATSDFASPRDEQQLAEWRAAQLSPVEVLTAPAECLACDDSRVIATARGLVPCVHCEPTVVGSFDYPAASSDRSGLPIQDAGADGEFAVSNAAAPLGGAARVDATQGDPARGEARPAGE